MCVSPSVLENKCSDILNSAGKQFRLVGSLKLFLYSTSKVVANKPQDIKMDLHNCSNAFDSSLLWPYDTKIKLPAAFSGFETHEDVAYTVLSIQNIPILLILLFLSFILWAIAPKFEMIIK